MLIVAFAKFHIQKLSYLLKTIPPCMSHTQKKLLKSKKQCFIAIDLDNQLSLTVVHFDMFHIFQKTLARFVFV